MACLAQAADGTPSPLPVAEGTASPTPEILTEFPGTFSEDNSPPSPATAASPKRVIQLTNLDYAITNRATGKTKHGTLGQLVGTTGVFLSSNHPAPTWTSHVSSPTGRNAARVTSPQPLPTREPLPPAPPEMSG